MATDPIELDDVSKQHEIPRRPIEITQLKKTHFYLTRLTPLDKADDDVTAKDTRLGISELLDLDEDSTSEKLALNRGWIHIPANDIETAEECIRIFTNNDVAKSVRESWDRKLRPRIPDLEKDLPTHAWSMNPSFEAEIMDTSTHKGKIIREIFTTYLNWEAYEAFLRKPQHEHSRTRHQRRTLHQSYYSGLQNIETRDAGQTVSKWTGKQIPEDGHPKATKTSLLLMVDQLWIWVLDPETLITCCPFYPPELSENNQTSSAVDVMSSTIDAMCSAIEDLSSPIFLEGSLRPWASDQLAAMILGHSVTAIFEGVQSGFGDPLAIYRWAIANKTARHTALLEAFWERRKNQVPEGLSGEGAKELELALELADILDELNILKRFFDQQDATLRAIDEKLTLWRWGSGRFPDIGPRKGEVRGLIIDAERTHKMVIELLDLEQKAASLGEAQTTTQQGRAVMLFTIITIVFLPLSFFVSYFGQNVSELTGDPQNPTSGEVWKVAAPISVVVIVLALAASFLIMYPWKTLKSFTAKKYESSMRKLRKWRGVEDTQGRNNAA